MSWEWSHTPEAYSNARAQTERLPKRALLTILREWAYEDREKAGTLRGPAIGPTGIVRGFKLPAGLKRLDRATLADLVWERAETHRTCSNGGWDCYLCPDGCHTVPFEAPEGMEGGS